VPGLRRRVSIPMPLADHLSVARQLERHHRGITRRNNRIAEEAPELLSGIADSVEMPGESPPGAWKL
jgi:hypothetical protein